MTNKLKAVAYIHIANSSQNEQTKSFNHQKEAILQVAEQQHIEIVKWWQHVGGNPNPSLDSILDFCENNVDVAYLFVADPIRISRSLDEYDKWYLSLNELGVAIKSASYAGNATDSERLFHLMCLVSARLHVQHSERIKVALGRKKIQENSMGE